MTKLDDFSKIIVGGNEIGKVLHQGKVVWEKEKKVLLIDWVTVNSGGGTPSYDIDLLSVFTLEELKTNKFNIEWQWDLQGYTGQFFGNPSIMTNFKLLENDKLINVVLKTDSAYAINPRILARIEGATINTSDIERYGRKWKTYIDITINSIRIYFKIEML